METYVLHSPLQAATESLIVIGHFEGEELPEALSPLDEAMNGLLASVLAGDFRGRLKEVRVLYTGLSASGPERIVLLGLGKRSAFDLEKLRRAAGEAAGSARDLRTGQIAYPVPFVDGVPIVDQARAIVEGVHLALYDFSDYRSETPEDDVPVAKLTLISTTGEGDGGMGQGAALGHLAAECQMFCRNLANTPGGDATPAWMAEQAVRMADFTDLSVKVLETDEMRELSMGGLLGVGQGSSNLPRLAILEHHADRTDLDTVCLVGKGITFDSGGISIKPSENMHSMKFDKCGACVVLAAMRAVSAMDLPLRVVGITPFAENLPSGTSYRPGDVLRIMNGKTIEVLNTDAEGRLILADALAYATRYEPRVIVDLATLTGACVVALGKHHAGLMSNDDDLADRLLRAGQATGELLWRLPLTEEYRQQIKSPVADMKNMGGKWGGAITAASLLAEFVGDCAWAHLDIAGVSWREEKRDYLVEGGTGFGVRLLLEFLRELASGENREV